MQARAGSEAMSEALPAIRLSPATWDGGAAYTDGRRPQNGQGTKSRDGDGERAAGAMGIRAPRTPSSMLVDGREGSGRSSLERWSGRMDHRGRHTTVKIG